MLFFKLCTLALFTFTDVLAAENEVSFSYSPYSDYGPSNWAQLEFDDVDNECDGSSQSPIYLNEHLKCAAFLETIIQTPESLSCTTDELMFAVTDHNVEAYVQNANDDQDAVNEGCSISLASNGNSWKLLSLHLHLGWEHQPESKKYGKNNKVELHLVHEGIDGSLLVLAVRFIARKRARDHSLVKQLLNKWGKVESACADVEQAQNKCRDDHDPFDIYAVIPPSASFFGYSGSLTTPPCSEIVNWMVVEEPIAISGAQYSVLNDLILDYRTDQCELGSVADKFNRTVREPQALNGRPVSLVCSKSRQRRQRRIFGTTAGASITGLALLGYIYKKKGQKRSISPANSAEEPLTGNKDQEDPEMSLT